MIDPGKMAPLLHKWFARRRPEAIEFIYDEVEKILGPGQLQVMDPFMGAGGILLGGAVRGHDVFGVDINPVAWMIARQTLNPPNLTSFQEAFQDIANRVRGEILELYQTETPDGTIAQTVTAFYVRVVKTPQKEEVELHHNYLIARNKKRDWSVYYCPECSAIFEGKASSKIVQCPKCDKRFLWSRGTVRRGLVRPKGSRKIYNLNSLYMDLSNLPRFRLIAVESYSHELGRQFHAPSSRDEENILKAASSCQLHPIAKSMLGTPIPLDRHDRRPISHGFQNYGELFTSRQLISLSLITEEISKTKDIEARYALALALSDTSGSNSLLCRYAADWLKLTPAFALHGFDVVTRPVEGNVWGADRGRGSFKNCVGKAIRAYTEIGASVSAGGQTLCSAPIRKIICEDSQNAQHAGFPKVDAIVTDPPYFDNLDYGELSDFYFHWLKSALNNSPPFDAVNALNKLDLASIASQGEGGDDFSNHLGAAFTSAVEKLKPDGIVAFSYHHRHISAWNGLLNALRLARLRVFKLLFVRSELDNGFHSHAGNIKVDAIFFCSSYAGKNAAEIANRISQSTSSLRRIGGLKKVDIETAMYAIGVAQASRDVGRELRQCADEAAHELKGVLDAGAI